MSATLDHAVPATASSVPAARLVTDTELLGQTAGSGLREPPYLVRRCDGQVVQLSRLLFTIASRLDGRSATEAAASAGPELGVRITPEQIDFVVERKLAPLGLVSADGRPPEGLAPRDVLLGLRLRTQLIAPALVRRAAGVLRPLFVTPVVAAALLALAATDVWLLVHGIGRGLHEIIRAPLLGLALIALTLGSLLWHELGHATACRYGGARPGRIGAGVYLVWPALFTDVTDSYRLGRAGRLRTDLGGVYFNGLFALAAMGAFLATRYQPLLVLIVGQQLILLDQFIPWMRLDGYHVVSDLIGVSDLFERIGPVMRSLRPGGPPQPRVDELKMWARIAVTGWVVSTVTVLGAMFGVLAVNASAYARADWTSIVEQARTLGHTGDIATAVACGVSIFLLSLPALGLLYTYLTLCHGAGAKLATRRQSLTTAALTQPPAAARS